MKRVLFQLLLTASGLGCGSEPSEDPLRCGSSGEFGNTGCADVRGLVTLANGAPAGGAYIDVVALAQTGWFVVGAARTSASGQYQLRVIRMNSEVPTSDPDTGAVWVRAVVPPPPGSPDAPVLRDSIQATVEIRPVGSTALVVEAETIVVRAP